MNISNLNKTNVNKNNFDVAMYKSKSQTVKLDESDKTNMLQIEQLEQSDEAETLRAENSIIIKISDEARKILEEAGIKIKDKFEEIRNSSDIERMIEQMESARKAGESMAEEFEVRRKCLIIAMRIISGDKVPAADHKYLAEKNPGLYGKSLMMRINRDNPKEHKRVSEDEEMQAGTAKVSNENASSPSDININAEQPEISIEVQ